MSSLDRLLVMFVQGYFATMIHWYCEAQLFFQEPPNLTDKITKFTCEMMSHVEDTPTKNLSMLSILMSSALNFPKFQ